MDQVEQQVREFYQHVDAGEFDQAVELFSENIAYTRQEPTGDTVGVNGKAAMYEFYTARRQLRGDHHDMNFKTVDNTVHVEGHFSGTLAGKPVELLYTDDFTFNADGKVASRVSTIWKVES